jgi:hypothetical protein
LLDIGFNPTHLLNHSFLGYEPNYKHIFVVEEHPDLADIFLDDSWMIMFK